MPKRRTDTVIKRARKTTRGGEPETPATPPSGAVVRPASLKGRAAEIWDEHAPDLVAIGMLTKQDALMFGLWCVIGAKIEAGELTPALATQFRLIGNDFGLSPSGKGREHKAPVASSKHKYFGD